MADSALVREARTDDEVRRCFPAVAALRPHLTEDGFVAQVARQRREQGYGVLCCLAEGGEVVSYAGYRFAEFLAWGRVLYIDDLVTLPEARGKGYAGLLLDELVARAREAGCDAVHLDSGHQRFDAHRLYLNKGFRITSHHFVRELKGE